WQTPLIQYAGGWSPKPVWIKEKVSNNPGDIQSLSANFSFLACEERDKIHPSWIICFLLWK
ncbi:hypothetical protein ACQP3L_40205, partial [Escherichia coli]